MRAVVCLDTKAQTSMAQDSRSMISRSRMARDCSVAAIFCLGAGITPAGAAETMAEAAESEWNKRLSVTLGGFWAQVDSKAQLARSDGVVGALVDFEDDLDLADRKTLPFASLTYRFNPRHRIEASYTDLSRSGTRNLEASISWGDQTFSQGTTVDSFLDTQVYRVAYGYSLINDGTREMTLLAGLHVTQLAIGIRDANGVVAQTATGTLPLPTIGLDIWTALSEKWRFRFFAQVFSLEFEEFDGSLTNGSLTFEHNTFRNAGFGFGWTMYQYDLKVDDGKLRGEFQYDFHGPILFLTGRF